MINDATRFTILSQVGDVPDGRVGNAIDLLWDSYEDRAAWHPRLQVLYTMRGCLNILEAAYRDRSNIEVAGSITQFLDQQFKHIATIRTQNDADIAQLEAEVRSDWGPSVGQLAATAPEAPPFVGAFDANSPCLRGDAYGRTVRRLR